MAAWAFERRDAAQSQRIANLDAQLAQTRAGAHADPPSAPPLQVSTARLDSAALDAIAARTAALLAKEERGPRPVSSAAPEPAPKPTPSQIEAREGSDRALDGVIDQGHATLQELTALRGSLPGDPEGAAELARRISVAINARQIVIGE
jgi:hypothetical protein